MAEIIQNTDKENREQTWTRAGLFVFVGILFVILASVILGESFYNSLFASVALDSCASFTATDKRQYVCYVPYAVYTKPLHFFEGPTYAPFMTVSDHKTVNGLDLGGAFFYGYGSDLQGVNFSGVRLVGAEFNGADFSWVELIGTDLSGMNLTGITLRYADLENVNLAGSNLTNAVLLNANLTDVNFESAVLISTNLTGAKVDLEALEAAATLIEVILPDGSIYTR